MRLLNTVGPPAADRYRRRRIALAMLPTGTGTGLSDQPVKVMVQQGAGGSLDIALES